MHGAVVRGVLNDGAGVALQVILHIQSDVAELRRVHDGVALGVAEGL